VNVVMLSVEVPNKLASVLMETIDIKSLQNRLLKVCYVPATSAGLTRLFLLHSH
jgi:hypothetical protein